MSIQANARTDHSRYMRLFYFSWAYIMFSIFVLFVFCGTLLLHGTTGVSFDLTQKGFIVSSVNHPDAELIPGDLVHTVDNISYEQLLHTVMISPFEPVDAFPIKIIRNGTDLNLIVANTQISIISLISESFSFLFLIVILIGLSIATLSRAPPGQPAHIFVFSMVSFALALIADLTLSLGLIHPGCMGPNFALTLFSGWMAFSGWTHFVLRYPQQRDYLCGRPYIIAAIYILPPVVSVLCAWLMADSSQDFWPQLSRVRTWAVPIIIPGTFFKHCMDVIRSDDPLVKNQLLAPMTAAVFGITPYLFLQAIPGLLIDRPLISSNIVAFSAVGIPLMFFLSLVRYRLFEVDRLISKIISYISLITLFSLLYSLFIWVLKRWFFGRAILSEELFMFFIIGIILVFQPLMNWLETRINAIFFRHRGVPARVFHTFTEQMTTSLKQLDIVHSIVHELPRLIHIQSAGIILIKEGRQKIFPPDRAPDHYPWPESHIFSLFKQADIHYFKTSIPDTNPAVARELKLLNEHGISIAFPLKSTLSQPGMLLIGPRKDGRFFSPEEILLLSGFANQTALALENASRYEVLVQSKKQLEALFHQKVQKEKMAIVGEISTTLAHELKNPLGIIHSSAQYIKKGKQSDQVKDEMLHYIIDEAEHLSQTIASLLGFARQRPPILKQIDLNAFLKQLVDRWCMAPRHRAQVHIYLDPPPGDVYFYGDRHQLTQVVHNLIENAEDMMPDGGNIHISTQTDKKNITILIQDTGPGIDAQDLGSVFNSFFTTKEKGLGLGLVVCKQIVTAHNGDIYLKNNAGSGLSVTIALPIKPLATGATKH